jgi:hypothetical protein
MDRKYEQRLGTILVVISLAILLFGLYQAYKYTLSPPSGTYNILTFNGGGGGSGSNVSGTFNGLFLATFSFLLIQVLVGGFILKAGWNLVSPKAETIQVRVKPKSLTVEPVGYSIPPGPPSSTPPAAPPPSGEAGADTQPPPG